MQIDERIDAIGRHPFRARLRLRGRERASVRLRQTPYRGFPAATG
jgi:hypothetical protein